MIIKTGQDFITYLEDTSNLSGCARALYIPESRQELIGCIRELSAKRTMFTLSAGRTGTTGGCVPREGVLISLERLNRIIDIDAKAHMAFLEAGVSLKDLEREAHRFNLTLCASPTEPLATVGGAISTAASGVRGFGYGSIRNYVDNLEVVLAAGPRLLIERGTLKAHGRFFNGYCQDHPINFQVPSYRLPEVKSQAGYFVKDNMDLIDMFIGSEGTLGVFASCRIQLQVMPYACFDGMVFFNREELALEFVETIKALRRSEALVPASLEFFDAHSLDMLKGKFSFIPHAAAAVYFEQEVKAQEEEQALLERWHGLITKSGALIDQSILATTVQERRSIFELRHSLPQMINEFLHQHRQHKAAGDIAVPAERLRDMFELYRQAAVSSSIASVNFGHIGESHLHFNFLPRNDREQEKARTYLAFLCRKAVSFGGTVSAEHGIGKIKKPYLKIMYTEEQIGEMARVKKYFDPHCLLGPDTLFDKALLNP